MKKIGFIGAFDKTDLILYIARIIAEMNKRVLVIDTTITQKAKYVVPSISPSQTYFTEYEKVDVAVGFHTRDRMMGYLGLDDNVELDYDYVLLDIDSYASFESFEMENADINYFVTSFDLYSLKRGLEILSGLSEPVKMYRVLYTKYASKAEDEYLDFLSNNYSVEWDEERIYFPFELGDQSIIIENQRVAKIKIKNLSQQYRENLFAIVGHIAGDISSSELRKIVKSIEKGV